MSFNFRARAEPLAFGYHDHATLSIRMTKFTREVFGDEKEDAEEFFKVLRKKRASANRGQCGKKILTSWSVAV